MVSPGQFRLRHAGEIREALITLDGDRGGFELIAHARARFPAGREGGLYAVVRSSDSDRVRVHLYDDPRSPAPARARAS